MLAVDMKHPREGKRSRDKAVSWLMLIFGVVAISAGVAMDVAIALKDMGIIKGEPTWKSAGISLFVILAGVELLTANITHWAGELLRAIAGRFAKA